MIREKKHYRRFVLGKTSEDTANGATKLQYRKTFEKGLVVSLVLTLFFFRLTASFDLERYRGMDDALNLEFIDIQDIPPPTEQPPQLKMEQVVEVIPEPEPVDDGAIEAIIEELLAENTETELDLESDMGYLISDSPLDVGDRARLNVRNRLASNNGSISLRRGASYLGEGGGLDIGSTKSSRRKVQSETASLDLPVAKKRPANRPKQTRPDAGEPTLGITGERGKVLSFSSSTIGTDGYRLWNKIISELDRLNKGRYGMSSSQIKRNRRGFTIQVGFDDETRQEIHWRNDGNVWIKIIGESRRTTLQELRRALSGILRVSL